MLAWALTRKLEVHQRLKTIPLWTPGMYPVKSWRSAKMEHRNSFRKTLHSSPDCATIFSNQLYCCCRTVNQIVATLLHPIHLLRPRSEPSTTRSFSNPPRSQPCFPSNNLRHHHHCLDSIRGVSYTMHGFVIPLNMRKQKWGLIAKRLFTFWIFIVQMSINICPLEYVPSGWIRFIDISLVERSEDEHKWQELSLGEPGEHG